MDDIDLQNFDLPDFRNQIGYVPQDVFLFSDTVTATYSFGMDRKTEAEAKKAAEYASIDKEISQFPWRLRYPDR